MTEDNQAALRAYVEGRNAFRDGLSPADCPYEEGHDLRPDWECGYEEAFDDFAESFGGAQ